MLHQLLMPLAALTAPPPPQPPPLSPPLQAILKIEWVLLPPLPVGVEDNDGGFIDEHTLTVAMGLSGHSYPGCVNNTYAINISQYFWDPHRWQTSWQQLPASPAPPRQEVAATVVDGSVIYCGGFNNAWQAQGLKQRTQSDMWRLSRSAASSGQFAWEQLPVALPYPIDGHQLATIDSKIYLFGGDFDEGKQVPPWVGSMLHVLDTRNVSAGWRRLCDCPGSMKVGASLTPAAGKLYSIGGGADAWVYDPENDSWTTLPDMPLPNPVKTNGNAAYLDRYIILIGGAATFNTTGIRGKYPYPAQQMRIAPSWDLHHQPIKAGGGGVCNVTSQSSDLKPGIDYWGYSSAVLVYDTHERRWGTITATSPDTELLGPNGECGPFPINVCLPQVGDSAIALTSDAYHQLYHRLSMQSRA